MTQRKRTIFNNEDVFFSNITGAAGALGTITPSEVSQMHRVQSTSYDMSINRQDIQELGKLARISSEIIEPPSVSFNMDYYLADGHNETGIGLDATTSNPPNAISGILGNLARAEKNIYVVTVSEGLDAHGVSPQLAANQFFSFGNCFLTSYSVSLSVGEIPSVSTAWECSNFRIENGDTNGIVNPAIVTTGQGTPVSYTGLVTFPTPSTGTLSVAALRPGDITLDFGTSDLQVGGPILPGTTSADTLTSMHVQSLDIEIPLSRTPQNRIGSAFPFSRELDVPITVTMSVSANLADIAEGSLIDLICDAEETRDIVVTLNDPCTSNLNMKFELKGAILESSSYSLAVGDSAKSVDLTFTAQLGGGNDQARGLFITKSA